MNLKNPKPRLDIDAWAERLEAGRTDDPELALASRLASQNRRPDHAAQDFRLGLRLRLLETYNRPTSYRLFNLPLRRVVPFAAAAVLLLIVLIAWPPDVRGVSAAEILRAAKIGAGLPAKGDVIYDRLLLNWDMGGERVENVSGEMWYAPDFQHYRYQLTSPSGELLFFQAYDGEHTIQSIHNQPIGAQPVEQVYRFRGFTPLWIDRPGEGGLLANPSPVNFWTLAVHQSMKQSDDCTDLYCLLGLAQEGWKCEGRHCRYDFGDVDGMGNMALELVVKGKTQLEDGRSVYELRLQPARVLSRFLSGFGTVYVDADTYQIVQVDYALKSIIRPTQAGMGLKHVERRGLEAVELPAGFFGTAPEGVAVIPWEGSLERFLNSQFGYHDNMAWVIAADPPSGSRLSGEVTFNLEVGYQLTGLPYADLGVSLWGLGMDTGTAGANMPVEGGHGVVQMSFTIDTDELAEGVWAVGPSLGTYLDVGSKVWINDLAEYYPEYCIRCDPAALPTPPAVLGTYWRPTVQAVTSGQIADGYRVISITTMPTRLLLHRTGIYDEATLPQTVETEPVDLTGLSTTTVFPARIVLPEGAGMIGEAEVLVTVEVEAEAP